MKKDAEQGAPEFLAWRFAALEASLQEANFKQADALIDSLKKSTLTPQEQAILKLLIADEQYLKGQFKPSKKTLAIIDKNQLNVNALTHFLIRYA